LTEKDSEINHIGLGPLLILVDSILPHFFSHLFPPARTRLVGHVVVLNSVYNWINSIENHKSNQINSNLKLWKIMFGLNVFEQI